MSISCSPNFTFSIDEHEMTVIEVDGTNVQPLWVDSIQIFAGKSLRGYSSHFTYRRKGQRYSFVVSWGRLNMVFNQIEWLT